jgi:EpsD family peptidyl-prolyl cis-trans isomerase
MHNDFIAKNYIVNKKVSVKTSLRKPILIGVCLGLATLVGCDKSPDAAAPNQLAAKVNKGEISIHQVNFALQGQPLTAEQVPKARKEVIDRLVDQEIVVQQALVDKLDRDPDTLQRLEAAKREILSRSYFEKLAAKVQKPEQSEVEEFFKKRPQLFANRKIYRSNEIAITRRPANWPELVKQLEGAKTLAEANLLLKKNAVDIPVTNNVVKASEALPIDLLSAFEKVKLGEVVIYPNGQQVIVAEIIEIKDAPVSQAQAGPVIEQFIMNQRRSEFLKAEMKRLKEGSQIALFGEFATTAAVTPAAVPTQPSTTVTPTAAPTSSPAIENQAPAATAPGATDKAAQSGKASESDAMSQGLKGGLK